jgi:mono/diheme cytochrome c family protein
MNSILVRGFTVGVIAVGIAAMAHAQPSSSTAQTNDVGKYEYESHCAVCHGLSGMGDGPYVKLLVAGSVLPNLTELSKKNGDVFPFQHVYDTIDGTWPIRAHSPTDMPIWGRAYKLQSRNLNPSNDPEAFAHAKILALTEYVRRLQAK